MLLVPVILARYRKHLEGSWRGLYVVGSVAVLYLNFFVLVDQLFRRVPALIVMAPTHKEPPYLLTQLVVLALFVVLGIAAYKRFPAPAVMVARSARMPATVGGR